MDVGGCQMGNRSGRECRLDSKEHESVLVRHVGAHQMVNNMKAC